jgi:hypothetical protein
MREAGSCVRDETNITVVAAKAGIHTTPALILHREEDRVMPIKYGRRRTACALPVTS